MKDKNIKFGSYLLITVILTLGLSISFQNLLAVWTPPTEDPAGGNVAEPINQGDSAQVKQGTLWLGGENYTANSGNYGLLVEQGNVGIGKTNPAVTLDVVGDIAFTGSIAGDGSGLTNILSSCASCDSNFVNEGQTDSINSSMVVNNSLSASDLGVDACGNSEMIDNPTFTSVIVGNSSSCTNGRIRFNSGVFEGCYNGSWLNLSCRDDCGSAWGNPEKKGINSLCQYGSEIFKCKSNETYLMENYPMGGGTAYDVNCNAGGNCWVRNHPSGSWHNGAMIGYCTSCSGE